MTTYDDMVMQTKMFKELDDGTFDMKEHDEMMLWLLKKDNVTKLFNIEDFLIEAQSLIKTEDDILVGFHDVVIKSTQCIGQKPNRKHLFKMYIGVKPIIKSFKKTMKQINTYRCYTKTNDIDKLDGTFYIFTYDLRYKEAFESQGITVLTMPSE